MPFPRSYSARWRHFPDGTLHPSIGPLCSPSNVFALPVCRQFSLLPMYSLTFHSTLQFPKCQYINTFSRLPTIHSSRLDLLYSFITFPGVLSTFNFPKYLGSTLKILYFDSRGQNGVLRTVSVKMQHSPSSEVEGECCKCAEIVDSSWQMFCCNKSVLVPQVISVKYEKY